MTDRATAYARAVVAGEVVTSRLVRQACARHLRDLETAELRGLLWDVEESEAVIDFFSDVLCLPEQVDANDDEDDPDADPSDGTPFVLQPWQQFIAGSLMGWWVLKGGKRRRRFSTAYIETAKGTGKSPLCAGILIYRCVADGIRGGQFYCAAAVKDQAKVAFADVEKMVAASPHLRDLFQPTVNNLAMPTTGSFIRAISSERRGLDGKRVTAAVLDEVHEHRDATVVNKMRKGTKGQPNALIMEPTNSGFDRTSVCWQHHEYSRKVLDGTVDGDDWFCFVCGLDPCDACVAAGKWFPDTECATCDRWDVEGPHWLKAHPNLGISVHWDYQRKLVNQAKGMPSAVSDLLRFSFCVWTQGQNRAIDMGKWAACQPLPDDSALVGVPCYGGLDMGESDDFCAWVRGWLMEDGTLAIKCRFWLPRAALERFPGRPYAEWERAKLLTVTEGEVTDYEFVRQQILEDCERDGVVAVAYDTRSATETAQVLQAAGIDMVPTRQGFALDEAIKRVLGLVREGELRHGRNRIMDWMASNAVLLTGTKGERRWAKEKSPEKIDGITALTTLVHHALIGREREGRSIYETRGLTVFGASR